MIAPALRTETTLVSKYQVDSGTTPGMYRYPTGTPLSADEEITHVVTMMLVTS